MDLLEQVREAGLVLQLREGRLVVAGLASVRDRMRGLIVDHLGELTAALVQEACPVDQDRRVPDEELRPHARGAGWACPSCGEANTVFYGLPPSRLCGSCDRQRPCESTPEPVAPTAADEPSPCPACGTFGSAPPTCPGCGAVTSHPPSFDHETAPPWWCNECLRGRIRRRPG